MLEAMYARSDGCIAIIAVVIAARIVDGFICNSASFPVDKAASGGNIGTTAAGETSFHSAVCSLYQVRSALPAAWQSRTTLRPGRAYGNIAASE